MLCLPFTSDEAKKLNQEFLNINILPVTASWKWLKKKGPYSSFEGSPMSRRVPVQYGEMKDEELSGR
jgi:ribonucleoside-diphosphate reductase alpha chain